MAESLNEILENLNSLKNNCNIFVPSIKKEIEFKPLTLKQQKDIIDSVTDGESIEILNFFNACYKIICENICNENIDSINIIDRPNILLNLRYAIDKKYEDINFEKLIESNKKIKIPELQTTVETDDFVFTIKSPTIEKDTLINTFITKTFVNEKNILGNLYIGELMKFIDTIKFKVSEKIVDFKDVSNKNKMTILQNIDSKNFKQIYSYINDIRDAETKFLTYEDKQIDISPDFFIF